MKPAQAYASVDKDGIRLALWSGPVHASAALTPAAAEELIIAIRRAIDKMPRVASAADLGMEAA